uniref:Uncharacterized protein n=1 Tax=Cyprinus carpio carpio TaxID=630221 RepID=A0A9J8D1I8_CYPCA
MHHLLSSKLSFRHVHQGVKKLVKLHSDIIFQDFLTEGEFPPAIISLCPILRDPFSTKGYINQDFGLLFNAETSNKLLERWETAFKQKIFNEAQSLTSTAEIGVFSMQQVDKDLKMIGTVTCHLSSCSCISCSREEEDQDQSNRGC